MEMSDHLYPPAPLISGKQLSAIIKYEPNWVSNFKLKILPPNQMCMYVIQELNLYRVYRSSLKQFIIADVFRISCPETNM